MSRVGAPSAFPALLEFCAARRGVLDFSRGNCVGVLNSPGWIRPQPLPLCVSFSSVSRTVSGCVIASLDNAQRICVMFACLSLPPPPSCNSLAKRDRLRPEVTLRNARQGGGFTFPANWTALLTLNMLNSRRDVCSLSRWRDKIILKWYDHE